MHLSENDVFCNVNHRSLYSDLLSLCYCFSSFEAPMNAFI